VPAVIWFTRTANISRRLLIVEDSLAPPREEIPVARMERSAMRDGRAGFHPGYVLRAA
jgi:hypothetical protein